MEEETGTEQPETQTAGETAQEQTDSPAVETETFSNQYLEQLILSYLKHQCFSKTAESFAREIAVEDRVEEGSAETSEKETSIECLPKQIQLLDKQELELLDLRKSMLLVFFSSWFLSARFVLRGMATHKERRVFARFGVGKRGTAS
jgi:hypothetical protein